MRNNNGEYNVRVLFNLEEIYIDDCKSTWCSYSDFVSFVNNRLGYPGMSVEQVC